MASGAVQDLTGAQIGAEYSGSVGLEFVQPIGAMAWFTQLDFNFTDDFETMGSRNPIGREPGLRRSTSYRPPG